MSKIKTIKKKPFNLIIEKETCDFCGTCVAVCPEDCIVLKEMEIEIDGDVCTMCMNCVKACPIHVIMEMEPVS